jgi:hypothetical protein
VCGCCCQKPSPRRRHSRVVRCVGLTPRPKKRPLTALAATLASPDTPTWSALA